MFKKKIKVVITISLVMVLIISTMIGAVGVVQTTLYNPDQPLICNTVEDINEYILNIEEVNSTASRTEVNDILVTITFKKALNADELEVYINEYELQITQIQARGYDENGNRITYASTGENGIQETYESFLDMKGEEDFAGFISVYAKVDSIYLIQMQEDDLTLLVDSSYDNFYQGSNLQVEALRNIDAIFEETIDKYPHSIAWDAEDFELVEYEILDSLSINDALIAS